LKVDFLIDASGILSVHAVEERSGKRAALQIVPSHGLTRDEVERMERESLIFARDDMMRHRIVDLVANAKLDIHWIGRQLLKVRPLLEPAYAAELDAMLTTLRGFVDAATADWKSVDANAFHATKESLDKLSVRLHEVSITESLKGQNT
jgi:molecular chaperone DnaK (HSP70)